VTLRLQKPKEARAMRAQTEDMRKEELSLLITSRAKA
jgi:hypothetical protein